MAKIQVKNISAKLHSQLRRYARQQECTLGDIGLEAIEREVAPRERHKRFSTRPATWLSTSAVKLLDEERRQRGIELSARSRGRAFGSR